MGLIVFCGGKIQVKRKIHLLNMIETNMTVESVLLSLKDKIESQMVPYYEVSSQVSVPESVTLIAIKSTKTLEMWWHHDVIKRKVQTYDILGASGNLGPKLCEGDKQVPEGIYTIEYLNPNSKFYLSLKINYPNQFDLEMAKLEGRTDPGSNIYIHGKSTSVGCLAMGDGAVEELFYIVGSVGLDKVTIIISPVDFRKGEKHKEKNLPWTNQLYGEISDALNSFKN